MYNVLVDSAGTVTCQSVIRGLRAAEGLVKRIITIDMDPMNAGRFMSDVFYKCPAADSPEYIDFLVDIVEEESIDVVIPVVDSGIKNIANNLDRFNDKVIVVVSPYDTILKCDNKSMTHFMFKNANILTPDIYADISDIPKYPVFVKPLE